MASERDPLPESPQVAARAIMILLGVGAVVVALSMAGLAGYYAHRARGLVAPAFGTFPAPRLDTSLQRTPQKRPPANRPAPPPPAAVPIAQAMAMVAARGAQAYDPPDGAAP